MTVVLSLIDKASKVCGGDTALAHKLGVHQPDISAMRHGKRKISPATAAELADIAGMDAREAVIAAVLESAKGTRREGVLREILGKAVAAGGAAMSLIFYKNDSSDAMEMVARAAEVVNRLYIVSSRRLLICYGSFSLPQAFA